MGKVIYAENKILDYLKGLSKLKLCSTGLILGQSLESKEYVVHLARTPEPSDSEIQLTPSPAKFPSVDEIKEIWITDHAKHIIKMLPGGIEVLGIFICSSSNIFSSSSLELKGKNILSHLTKQLMSEHLFEKNSSFEKILMHFNTVDFQYNCKSYNFVTNTIKSADVKFQNNYTKWCTITCNFNLNPPSFGGSMSCRVKEQLMIVLTEVDKSLEKAKIVINNQIKNSNDLLETIFGNQNLMDPKKTLPCLKANIYMPWTKTDSTKNVTMNDCNVELHLLGVVASYSFLSQKTTINEAIKAIKQDIIRSLTTRFEMHWDSLVEEEYGSPEEKLTVHEPPRRILVCLPDSVIAFNDYLFPGEGFAEVVSSFKEMLDVDISEANMEKEIEIQGDSMEFYGKSTVDFSIASTDELYGSSSPKTLVLFLFSFLVILIAFAVGFLIHREHSK